MNNDFKILYFKKIVLYFYNPTLAFNDTVTLKSKKKCFDALT